VAAPSETLEALVRDELRGPVSELVRRVVVELVREELSGYAPASAETTAANGTAPTTRVCKTCKRELALDRFAKHRHDCKSCRNARYPRNRRARSTAAVEVVAAADAGGRRSAGAGCRQRPGCRRHSCSASSLRRGSRVPRTGVAPASSAPGDGRLSRSRCSAGLRPDRRSRSERARLCGAFANERCCSGGRSPRHDGSRRNS
jgi:hypothetical protein